ncbi:hypothetical protein ACOME3_003600 [Neoechinorhynchus agilis]
MLRDFDNLINIMDINDAGSIDLANKIYDQAFELPNFSHPDVPVLQSNSQEPSAYAVSIIDQSKQKARDQTSMSFEDFSKRCGLLRRSKLGKIGCTNAYALYGELALLEYALVRHAISVLQEEKFEFIKVTDTVDKDVVEKCGFKVDTDKVYRLVNSRNNSQCLAGTAEMTIAHNLIGRRYEYGELPKRYAAQSRCFRAEISTMDHCGPLYRVHEFDKVEMFVVSIPENSNDVMADLYNIQKRIMNDIGLCFRALDMPTNDLGLPAYRKFDIEAFLPSEQKYGEKYMGGRPFLKASCEWRVNAEPELFYVNLLENKTGYGVLSWEESHKIQLQGRKDCNQALLDAGLNASSHLKE